MFIDHRYEVLRELGSGGMGAVYLARDHLEGDRLIALKCIREGRAALGLQREFELLARLRHPNLAEVYDFGWDAAGGQHYFTCEYVDGAPFAWHGTERPFEWLLLRTVELCRALARVHREGLLHCDVKPENALIAGESEQVKLLDFGLAMAATAEPVPPRGTLPFMAPEWLRGETPDPRADLYGLGMLLYRATFGCFPFAGTERREVLRFHLEKPARAPRELPDVPAWWPTFILRLLAKEPKDRFASARAALAAINVQEGAHHPLETDATWQVRLCGGRFVGRDEIVRELDELIARATREGESDSPAETLLTVLEGERGAGKSRWLLEIKRALQLRGTPVLLEEARGDTSVERLLAALRSVLGPEHAAFQVCSALGAGAPSAPGAGDGSHEIAAFQRMVSAMGDLLLAAGRAQELVVLLDQAEQMDALTVAILSYVVHAVDYTQRGRPGAAPGEPRPRLAIVLAHDDAPSGPLEALLHHPLTRRLTLRALEPPEVASLLTTLLGERELPDTLVREVTAACGGNPERVRVLLSMLIESGTLLVREEEVVWSTKRAAPLRLPRTLEESLARLIAELPSEEREVLDYLSLLNEPCPLGVLATAMGYESGALSRAVETLEILGLSHASLTSTGRRVAPAGRVLAGVVASRLSAAARREHNERLQGALCKAPEERPSAATLAHHLELAEDFEVGFAVALSAARGARWRGSLDRADGELTRARRMAGDSAERILALAEEEAILAALSGDGARAVSTLESAISAGGAALDSRRRALWLRRLAEARSEEGSHAEAATALEDALTALGEEHPKDRAAVLAIFARLEFFRGDYQAARTRATAALRECRAQTDATWGEIDPPPRDHAPDDPPLFDGGSRTLAAAAAHSHATLGLVASYGGDPERGLAHLTLAVDLHRVLCERRELVFAENALGLVYHQKGERRSAIARYEESLRLARVIGDQRRETKARMNLSVVHQEAGEYREAIERYLESQERAYRVQDHASLMRIANNLANIHRFLGRLTEAELWLQRSLKEAEALGDTLLIGYNLLIQGEVHLLRGELEPAGELLSEAAATLKGLDRKDVWLEARLDQAEWLLFAGRHEEADNEAREVVAEARRAALGDHLTRGLLTRAAIALDRARAAHDRDPDGDGAATVRAQLGAGLRLALEALVEIETRENPELCWRVYGALAEAYAGLNTLSVKGGQAELLLAARHALERASLARVHLEERLPVEMRPTFFERRDRHALSERLEELAERIKRSPPQDELGPAALLPAGDSLVRLLEVNKRLNSEHRLDRLLNTIMDAVIDLTGAERGFVLLDEGAETGGKESDGEGDAPAEPRGGVGKLTVAAARNMDRETVRKSKFKISHTIAEEVITSGRPIHTVDAREDERYRDYVSIHSLRLRSIACYPLQDRGSTFGALYLDNRFQAQVFDERHRALLEAFVEQAAVAITNARLHERAQRMMQELEQSRDQVERLNLELERRLMDQSALLDETRAALSRRQDEIEARFRYGQMVGHSAPMQAVYGLIERVKDVDISVVIQGDSGTGKELVARAIHYLGNRREKEFVSLNCAAFPETLLESELFGHKRGSFTGAERDKRGLFQVAHKGTLFLDEVGDMSLGMQAKLLRALQEQEIRPVGGHEAIKIDVRVIAASNQDLKEMIRAGKFREDLYYRLNVVTIRIPPLRERREDIPQLINHFLERLAGETNREPYSFSKEAMQILMNYDWPGNVRELMSTVQTASLFASGPTITPADLANKPEIVEAVSSRPEVSLGDRTLVELEREAIIQALKRTGGNKMAAAKALGISRRSLYNKLKQYDIRLTTRTSVVN